MAGFPKENSVWPPREMEPVFHKMAEWAAWYSGDTERLVSFYARSSVTQSTPWWRFWSRANEARQNGSQRAHLHVPITSDLAATSAALLFSESPRVRIKEAHEDETPQDVQVAGTAEQGAPNIIPQQTPPDTQSALGKPLFARPGVPQQVKKPDTPAQKSEARLLDMIDETDVFLRLMEAAESSAAIGGVYIYPAWDKDLSDSPFVAVAQADMAVPTFRFGYLAEVMFHRVVTKEGNQVYRHLELHTVEGTGDARKAVVYHKLFRGTDINIGVAVNLGDNAETSNLQQKVELPFQELDVEYVPNIRPNRLWRASYLGVADIQGSETLLDALDETYASWMRDVRLAKARIIVPSEYLRWPKDANGNSIPTFDLDQEIYTPMEMMPDPEASAKAMMAHQFEIRYIEHRDTALAIIERIVSNAGYVPSTIGISGVNSNPLRGTTGTALRISEHKTILTQRRKAAQWRRPIANVLYRLQLIDQEIFKSGVEPIKPVVEMSDSIIDQPLELAQTALAMNSANAASTETLVRLLHPSWTEAEIASEVLRIKDQAQSQSWQVVPPKFGDPGNPDQASTQNMPRKPLQQSNNGAPLPPPPKPFAKKG